MSMLSESELMGLMASRQPLSAWTRIFILHRRTSQFLLWLSRFSEMNEGRKEWLYRRLPARILVVPPFRRPICWRG